MKKILLAVSLMAVALPLAAQDDKKPPTNIEKLIMLQYADPDQVSSLLRVFNATLVPNNAMHTIAVRATAETMAAVEDAIKKLDVAPAASKNIELMVYLLVGSQSETQAVNGIVPKDLDPVVTQLKNAFAFKNYGLLDTLTLRTRTGQEASTTSNSSMKLPVGPESLITNFRIRSASIGTDGMTVRIDQLRCNFRVPVSNGSGGGFSYSDLGMNADVDIKEGQKVVVGRLGISADQAMFLVLMAKIVP